MSAQSARGDVKVSFLFYGSHNVHNFFSTHLFTLLIICVIVHIEQRKRDKKKELISQKSDVLTKLKHLGFLRSCELSKFKNWKEK